jgi:hypothetical protein
MLKTSESVKRYKSAQDRFLKPAIANFFKREFPNYFGPVIRKNIADELIKMVESLTPSANLFKPGQIFWNALDKTTRADSPKRKYKPVILTLITEDEIEMLTNGKQFHEIRKKAIARMIEEAYAQGGILTMRDIGLLLLQDPSSISRLRIKYEEENNVVLPHSGALHDMGSCVTHKREIIYKAYVEKKDPVKVANETNHSQSAVDRYLIDFHRVKTLIRDKKDDNYINIITNISKSVIRQYRKIYEEYVEKHQE